MLSTLCIYSNRKVVNYDKLYELIYVDLPVTLCDRLSGILYASIIKKFLFFFFRFSFLLSIHNKSEQITNSNEVTPKERYGNHAYNNYFFLNIYHVSVCKSNLTFRVRLAGLEYREQPEYEAHP